MPRPPEAVHAAPRAALRDPGRDPFADAAPVRVLLLSTVFPNAALPEHGTFVRDRMRALPPEFAVRVFAPRPWFPGTTALRPGLRPRLPPRDVRDGVAVEHPRFASVPAVLKSLDALSLAMAVAPRLRRLRRSFPFQVIDAHFAYPEGVAAVILGRLLRVPVTITLRGSEPEVARHRLRRSQMAWALRRATRVVAVSESLRQEAVRLGRPASRVRVIGNGVDAGLFAPHDRAASRAAIGLPEGTLPVLLAVGTLSRRKGFDLAIGALRELAPEHPDARLVIVGGAGAEGAVGDELAALARRLGVDERVVFAGPRSREELATYYSAADFLVLPSALEGCPNVVLEALACGTPVVATPVGAVPELLASAGGGELASPRSAAGIAAAVRRALGQRFDREALRAWSLRRTWEVVGREVGEELRAAIEAGPESRSRPRIERVRPRPGGTADLRSALVPAAAKDIHEGETT